MTTRILIAGAGYVGLYVARRLERATRAGQLEVTLINPDNFMTYRPLLPEVAAGTLEPRHAVVPLRAALRRTRVLTGRVSHVDSEQGQITVSTLGGQQRHLDFDHLVIAFGSITQTMPVPGLGEHAIGFTSLTEATHLRNHVLHQLETAAASTDEKARDRALTFIVVGGGYTGVEALGELHDMTTQLMAGYHHLVGVGARVGANVPRSVGSARWPFVGRCPRTAIDGRTRC